MCYIDFWGVILSSIRTSEYCKFSDELLQQVSEMKNLGVIFDSTLEFNKYSGYIKAKSMN